MTWTTQTPTGLRNVHERDLAVSVSGAWSLIETLGGRSDVVWPSDRWPALRLDCGLQTGSAGGHGPIRYRVSAVDPESSVRFTLQTPGLEGWHGFVVEPASAGSRVRHVLEVRSPGLTATRLILPLHDALLEDLFDQLEARVEQRPVHRRPLSLGIRVRRALVRARSRSRRRAA